MVREATDICLRVLKESNKSRFDSFSRYEQCIDHIPYYFSGLSRAHFFRQPFSKVLAPLSLSRNAGRGVQGRVISCFTVFWQNQRDFRRPWEGARFRKLRINPIWRVCNSCDLLVTLFKCRRLSLNGQNECVLQHVKSAQLNGYSVETADCCVNFLVCSQVLRVKIFCYRLREQLLSQRW